MNLKQFNICMVNNIAVICERKNPDPDVDLKYFSIIPSVQLKVPGPGKILVAGDESHFKALTSIKAKDTATYELVKLRDLKPIELVSTRKSVYVALTNKAHFKNKLGVINI